MPLIEISQTSQVDNIFNQLLQVRSVKLHCMDRLNAIAELSANLLGLTGKDEVIASARALGFSFRKSSLEKISQSYLGQSRFGRGIIFQIAPSNTPVSGLYGAIYAFLSGNVVLTRISPLSVKQIEPVLDIIDQIEYSGSSLSKFMNFVAYSSDDREITRAISKIVDGRILWGGDQTINELRSYLTKPSCIDIAFPDKYSIAVFKSDFINSQSEDSLKKLSKEFLRDLMTFDQNACSSPKVVNWVGSKSSTKFAREKFFRSLDMQIDKENIDWSYVSNQAIQAMRIRITGDYSIDQLESGFINYYEKKNENCEIDFNMFKFGNVLECNLESLDEISKFSSPKLQTCTYVGFEGCDIDKIRSNNNLSGFDRIVPIGMALQMSEVWDGIDFFESLSRKGCVI